jgi:hypothetical protein
MKKRDLAGIGLFLILAVLITGCTEQQVTVMDNQITIDDKGQFTLNLDPGKYRVVLQSDESVDVSFSTVSSYDKTGVTQYDTIITLASTSVMTIKNPGLIGLGPGANVMVRVVKNPA